MKLLRVIALVVAGATVGYAFAQTPAKTPAAVPVPTMDAASKAALSPIGEEIGKLVTQIQPLMVQLNTLNSQWRTAEGKALATGNLDPMQWEVNRKTITFEKRAGGMPGR